MAKKKAKDNLDIYNDGNTETPGNRIVTALIAIVFILIWLGVFAVLIKLDVGGFGSTVLGPVLKDVPVVNKILPNSVKIEGDGDSSYGSLEEAIERIKELELKLDATTDTSSANIDYITELEDEIGRLRIFEQNQATYEERLLEFETEVVFNDKAPDIDEYKAYYESISPDNAEEIYRQVVEQMEYDKKIKEMGERYAKMDPADAAAILEVMTGDLDLVANILSNMKTVQSSLILAEMTPQFGAKMTKKMSSME